jgi:shikimate kinase
MPASTPEDTPLEASRLTRPIVLVGLMGAGKTSVGRRLAAALGANFVDSDDEIVDAAGMSIADIFENLGEAHFRDGERRVLARLLSEAPQVIATGGGAFMNPETRALIKARAVSVWLRAALDTLLKRVSSKTTRPLLQGGDPREILHGLMTRRHPVYAEADVVVESFMDDPHEAVVARIVAALKQKAPDLLREENRA